MAQLLPEVTTSGLSTRFSENLFIDD